MEQIGRIFPASRRDAAARAMVRGRCRRARATAARGLPRAAADCSQPAAAGTCRSHARSDGPRPRALHAAGRSTEGDLGESGTFLWIDRATDAPHPRGSRPRTPRGEAWRRCSRASRSTSQRRRLTSRPAPEDVLAVDLALERLATLDPEQARVVELRFFAGLTVEETAHVVNRSPRTVKREWRLARAWLFRELRGDRAGTTQ